MTIIKIVNDNYFWYDAELSRRKAAIANAFDINLQPEKTEGYYNNRFEPSIYKYGVNIFESNYFSYEIAKAMLTNSIVKAAVSILALLISTRFLKSDELFLIVAQTIFSSNFIIDAIQIVFYHCRMKDLFYHAYNFFVTGIKSKDTVWIQCYVVEYEAVKAHYKVRLDVEKFQKMNAELSRKWKTIQKEICYLEKIPNK